MTSRPTPTGAGQIQAAEGPPPLTRIRHLARRCRRYTALTGALLLIPFGSYAELQKRIVDGSLTKIGPARAASSSIRSTTPAPSRGASRRSSGRRRADRPSTSSAGRRCASASPAPTPSTRRSPRVRTPRRRCACSPAPTRPTPSTWRSSTTCPRPREASSCWPCTTRSSRCRAARRSCSSRASS